jgi:arginase
MHRLVSLLQRRASGAASVVQPARTGYDIIPSFSRGIDFSSAYESATLFGAAGAYGGPLAGPDHGPEILRAAGVCSTLEGLGWRVEDRGDIVFPKHQRSDPAADPLLAGGHAHCSFALGGAARRLADEVERAIREDPKCIPLTLGGDQASATLGSLPGILRCRPNTAVLSVGAHACCNTPASSPSGSLHGMVWSLLCGSDRLRSAGFLPPLHEHLPGLEWLAKEHSLNGAADLALVGLRDVDPEERLVLRRLGVKCFTMCEIDRLGVGEVMRRALSHLGVAEGERPLHLSVDIGCADPEVAASASTARGGLSYRESHYIMEAASDTGSLGSVDMVEVNPALHRGGRDTGEETARVAVSLLASAFGSRVV